MQGLETPVRAWSGTPSAAALLGLRVIRRRARQDARLPMLCERHAGAGAPVHAWLETPSVICFFRLAWRRLPYRETAMLYLAPILHEFETTGSRSYFASLQPEFLSISQNLNFQKLENPINRGTRNHKP